MKLTNDRITFDDKYESGKIVALLNHPLTKEEWEQILKNQKMCEYYQKFDTEHDMLKVLEKAEQFELALKLLGGMVDSDVASLGDKIMKLKEDAEKFYLLEIRIKRLEDVDYKQKQIVEVVKKYRETIIGCMKQSDANFVYEEADKAIEALEAVLGEK